MYMKQYAKHLYDKEFFPTGTRFEILAQQNNLIPGDSTTKSHIAIVY